VLVSATEQLTVDNRHKVALDARRLAGNRRGVGLYVHNLVRYLPSAAPDIDFLLLVDRPLPPDWIPAGFRAIVVGGRPAADSQSVSGFSAKLYSIYWMNVLVPAILKRERVDLFHGANMVVPLVGGCRSVSTIHDLVSQRLPGTLTLFYESYRKLLDPAVARRAVHIVAVSESTKRDIVDLLRVPAGNVTTIHHGVDSSFTRERFGLPERYIIHVGAVERQKRLEPLMSAAAAMMAKGLVDGVVLAGEEGRGAENVRRVVAELGISERVKFLGYVPQEFIAALFTLARCAVYPSWYEGFGMPVLEAMACGTPVIASNASSLPEVGGDAAILLPPGDVSAMTQALEQLLTDERLRADRASRGSARAKRFTWEACAARHAGVYRRFNGQTGDERAVRSDEKAGVS
jgi:glycosyltransferase involved in cell wall biosynthesis